MRKYHAMLWLLTAASGSLLLQSCKDDDYDLSDIDTTIKAEVKDLTLPINIEPIELGGLIELDPNGSLKTFNGEYVFLQDGTINESAPIKVPTFTAPKPNVPAINVTLTPAMQATNGRAGGFSFNIGNQMTRFSYREENVSQYIRSITSVGVDFSLTFNISITAPAIKALQLENMQLQLPAGLTPGSGCDYDTATGIVRLPATVQPTASNGTHSYSFSMNISAIDMAKAGAVLKDQVFTFASEIGIKAGTVTVSELNSGATATSAALNISIDMSPIAVRTVTGTVAYTIDNFRVDPIEITDLPEVLTDSKVNLVLTNPQIYLSVNNPLEAYNMHANTGISITPYRDNAEGSPCVYPGLMEIFGANDKKTTDGQYQYCLSPKKPTVYYEPYQQANQRTYPSLGHVLSGDGLPTSLQVDFESPQLPAQTVADFELGHEFPGVKGSYTLYAPLALGAESELVYTDTSDGWFDSDMANLTVERLEVTAVVSSNLPVEVSLSGIPVDKNGKEVTTVQVEGPTIPAGAQNQSIVIRITGEILSLDGIKYKATVKGNTATEDNAIGPDLSLSLKDIRATVSGYYIDTL